MMLLLNFMIAGAVCWTTLAIHVTTEDDAGEMDQELNLHRKSTAAVLDYLQSLIEIKHRVCPCSPLKPVHVYLNLTYSSFPSLDDTTQTMTTSILLNAKWKDKALAWNASDFNGVNYVNLPDTFIWTPKIYSFNSQTFIGDILDNPWSLDIYSDGDVLVFAGVQLKTECKLDLTQYPYDTQDCSIFISTNQQDGSVILHQNHELAIELFTSLLKLNAEWDFLGLVAGDWNYIPDSVTFRLRRKTTFYTACLMLPMVLTSFMNTLVFLVPLHSGEKISFIVTIFVSTSVFVGFFNDVMPRGLDRMPVIMKLLASVVVQSLLVLVATLVIMMVHAKELDTDTSSPQSSHRKESHAMNDHPAIPKAKTVFQNKVNQEKVADDENVIKISFPDISTCARSITAKRLDLICFVVFLIANVTTLVVLYID